MTDSEWFPPIYHQRWDWDDSLWTSLSNQWQSRGVLLPDHIEDRLTPSPSSVRMKT